jgi:hypothetical protein
MIAFGVAVSDPETYEAIALPSIKRVAEPDTRILTRVGYDSIQRPYNEMIEEASALPGLEALVLMHQDVELVDGSLPTRIRPPLSDPSVGIVGAFGWRGSDPRYWPGVGRSAPLGIRTQTATAGRQDDQFFGQGHSEGPEEVELIDGILMALAPWVVRSLRFDERLAERFHGYDLDFSLRVTAARGRLICDPIPHIHHQKRLWREREELVQARIDLARRWDPDVRPPEWAPAFQA